MSVQDKIAALAPWHFNVHLPDGTHTAPGLEQDKLLVQQWLKIKDILPEDLTGWKVLNVGCSSGFHAVELAKRGAYVVAVDTDEHCLEQASWLAEQFCLKNKIIISKADLGDLEQDSMVFDLALCIQDTTNAPYPDDVIEILAKKTKKIIISDTNSDELLVNQRLNDDRVAAVQEMQPDAAPPTQIYTKLKNAGFNVNYLPQEHIYSGERVLNASTYAI